MFTSKCCSFADLSFLGEVGHGSHAASGLLKILLVPLPPTWARGRASARCGWGGLAFSVVHSSAAEVAPACGLAPLLLLCR